MAKVLAVPLSAGRCGLAACPVFQSVVPSPLERCLEQYLRSAAGDGIAR